MTLKNYSAGISCLISGCQHCRMVYLSLPAEESKDRSTAVTQAPKHEQNSRHDHRKKCSGQGRQEKDKFKFVSSPGHVRTMWEGWQHICQTSSRAPVVSPRQGRPPAAPGAAAHVDSMSWEEEGISLDSGCSHTRSAWNAPSSHTGTGNLV